MRFRLFLLCFASLLIAQARAQTDTTRATTPASRSTTTARPGAKGPLPDPVLLDGSSQPAEKKPDYGMLGEFEIPGDENSKSGKVGGQQDPNQKGGGGGGQQQAQNQTQQGGGGQMAGMPMPQGGGGPQGQQGGQQSAAGAAGAAGGAQGGQQGKPGAQGTAGAAGGDPTGKADGIQVAGLEGDPSAAGAAGGPGGASDNVQKPQQVAIGDPSMQIKPAPGAAAGVVGQVAAGSTQQMESKIGKGAGGGGGGAPTSGGGGRAVEKGRTMPAGL